MTKKKKKMSGKKIALIVIAALVAVVALLSIPYTLNGADKDSIILLKRGGSREALADTLKKHFDESYADRVMTMITVTRTHLSQRHGAFEIKKGDSPLKVALKIRNGKAKTVTLTFNNVRTKQEFIDRVSKKFMASKAEFTKAFNSPEVCKKFGRTPDDIVMILIPDSYEFYWDITPEEMLEKFDGFYKKFWNDERVAKAKKLGLTPDQMTIVASIAEEETSKADERGKVGQLYINRINKKMRLQADPTVKFAIGDFSIKRITNAMLQTDSPYNTYMHDGLPPGPIRLPKRAPSMPS